MRLEAGEKGRGAILEYRLLSLASLAGEGMAA
jgi:hypothetical protein